MTGFIYWVCVVLTWLLTCQSAAYGCTTDLDCSLNGICVSGALDAVAGCRCDGAWKGIACSVLAIAPRDRDDVGAYGVSPNITSWGGNILLGDDGLYHLFVSEMADDVGGFCGLHQWTTHSRIAHAVATTPLGSFQRKDVALEQQAHNASPLRLSGWKLKEANNRRRRAGEPIVSPSPWYLFHIGSATGEPVSNCSSSSASSSVSVSPFVSAPHFAKHAFPGTEDAGGVGAEGSFLHVAAVPEGPWTPLPNLSCNNPAPMFHNNGTMYVGCNAGGTFKVYRTDDPREGHWVHLGDMEFPPSWGDGKYLKNEDPYLWMDTRDNWHFIAHRYDYRDGYPPNPNQTEPVLVSGHGFSQDGIVWNFSDVPPYGNTVNFTDGSVQEFATWERPHLVFDETTGEMTHLVNGVSSVWGDPPCALCDARPGSEHSCVVCKTSRGVDWTYTLVSKLATK